jgi:uncharacterized protein (DUF885 family)
VTDASPRAVRDLADSYVNALAGLNPLLATMLGLSQGQDRLPDLSPAGQQALDDLARDTLARLAGAAPEPDGSVGGRPGGSGGERPGGSGGGRPGGSGGGCPEGSGDERRCGRLLSERLHAALAASEAGEHLRDLHNIFGPASRVRSAFLLMPAQSPDDWAVIARRMARVPGTFTGYRASLAEGMRRGLLAAPRQAQAVIGQLGEWAAAADGRGWFAGFAAAADVPPALRADLDRAAAAAMAATMDLHSWLAGDYLPAAQGTPDAAGPDRYRIGARQWTGAGIDPVAVYDWGWDEYQRLSAELRRQAGQVLPGASPREAMDHLNAHGDAADGVPDVMRRLQQLLDDTVAELSPAQFDLPEPVKRVEARQAPAGSAAAPYYTRPSLDFARPGRTWLPTLGQTRFPMWHLVSAWYHEGVPGHHLQLALWTYLADRLSVFQTTAAGSVSACSEGWALYAERLMDEFGYYRDPGARLGYLDSQLMRAIRVVIDIGMHLRLPVRAGSPLGAGETWTPELGQRFLAAHSGRGDAFVSSEIVRYLGAPGQAISYKLGERAWLAGREAARAARGDSFDLAAWHRAALSLGALGLDDLPGELASL